ncbi:hypothetical protein [Nonomuraea sp. NPDC049480]|uniref:hypothetical protein n=1 Tax=Nonomuraea sp. NPDC049480 TaxID=3364353 RepID=UPI00378CECE4
MKGQLERRAAVQDQALIGAPTTFDGMPVVIHERPTWSEIVPREDVAFGRSLQRAWSIVIRIPRALAVWFLIATETWYTFAVVMLTLASIVIIYATR